MKTPSRNPLSFLNYVQIFSFNKKIQIQRRNDLETKKMSVDWCNVLSISSEIVKNKLRSCCIG